MLTANRDESARLRAELARYLSHAVDDGSELRCASAAKCRASVGPGRTLVEGQLSHVGSHYALEDDGAPLRVLIVPKQVGGSVEHGKGRGDEHVSVDARGRQVESAKHGTRPHPRTPHMDGTALALKALLGVPARGPDTGVLDGHQVHVFDCFAMANATLCSRVGSDASGQGTSTMFNNCQAHLRQTIEILRPTVIVAQGWDKGGWSPSRASATALGVPMPAKNSCTVTETDHGRVALAALVHPARNWVTVNMPTWNLVEQVLVQARAAVRPA